MEGRRGTGHVSAESAEDCHVIVTAHAGGSYALLSAFGGISPRCSISPSLPETLPLGRSRWTSSTRRPRRTCERPMRGRREARLHRCLSRTSRSRAGSASSRTTASRSIPASPRTFRSWRRGAPRRRRTTPSLCEGVAFQFDDPSTGVVAYDGAKRPIVGFLDANYIPPHYTLPAPFTFAGKQYTKLSISTWGAIAFGDADTTQVNYDPTVVSSMFHIQPIVAVWYELFNYPSTARIITKNKPGSVVITWQNRQEPAFDDSVHIPDRAVHRHRRDAAFVSDASGDDGLIGFNTGTETATHQTAAAVSNAGIPAPFQAASASFDNYGGIIAGVTLKLSAPIPNPAAGESFRYTLMVNGVEAIGLECTASQSIPRRFDAEDPRFPGAQINSWETRSERRHADLPRARPRASSRIWARRATTHGRSRARGSVEPASSSGRLPRLFR